jgi:PAS domain S-box-containing protein
MIAEGVDRSPLARTVGRISGARSPVALGVAAVLFATVLILRLTVTTPGLGYTLLYDVPVALVAIAYGFRAGLLAAAVGFGLYVLGENAAAIHINGMVVKPKWEAYLFRGATFVLVGGLVGLYSDHSRAVERRFREVLESAPDAMLIVDDEGTILLANHQAQHLFGFERDDLVGRTVESLIPERFKRELLSHRDRYLENPEPQFIGQGLELYALRYDETEVPVEIALSPLATSGGVLISVVIRDVTERRRAEADLKQAKDELESRNLALERSNADLVQFAHLASHDLQEPLRVIGGFVQLLDRRHAGKLDEETDRYIAAISTGVERMQQLIDALLSYARAGNDEAVRQPVDTAALVDRVTRSMREQLDQAHGRIDANGLPVVDADPVLLEQLLRNLLSNALKFCEADEPVISVDATQSQGYWEFSVKDNGPGIEARYRERVFEIFNRLHGRSVAGTGIGLAICKRITERHGGRIWVEEAEGGGSDFRFTLSLR